jgi:hypothetical protein
VDAECCAPGKCIGGDGCSVPYGGTCSSAPECYQNDGLGSATNSQCVGGKCCASHENSDCTQDSDCCPVPAGMKCQGPAGETACYVPLQGACTSNADCGYDIGGPLCTDGGCCWPAGAICAGGAAACCSGVCPSGGYCQ